jgi:alkyl hydroperoxide reductase subunit F
MLDANIKTQLKAYLERVTQPIEIVASLDDGPKSKELLELLHDVAEQSKLITLVERRDDDERKPSFSVGPRGGEARVRFAGLPMGHEFTSLILALLQAGGYPPKVEADVIEQIKNLDVELNFETYISLSCHNCPDVVQALNLMAVLNPKIRHTMIDGALFQKEVEERQIMAVPTVYLNGEEFDQGRLELGQILAKVDTGAAARDAKKLSEKDRLRRARRRRRPGRRGGGDLRRAQGHPHRRGGRALRRPGHGHDGDRELHLGEVHRRPQAGRHGARGARQGIRSRRHEPAARRQAWCRARTCTKCRMENGASLKAKTVIVATGARWREMNVPGEKEFRGKGVAYCPHCDGPLFKGKRVAVIGGGNSGVEAAIDLAGIVAHVTLLEFADDLRADAVLQKKLYSLPNVTVIKSAQTTEVTGADKVNGLTYKDRKTNAEHRLELEGIFVQIGLLPNTDFLKGTLELSRFGEVIVDAKGQTSVPGMFAAGDCTTVPYKQIIIAMGEGPRRRCRPSIT